jgi:hypothetical protein
MVAIPSWEEVYERINGSTLVLALKLKVLYALSEVLHDIPGDVAELGVYTTGSCRLLAMCNPHKKVYAFDTFEGMPWDDEHGNHKAGDFTVNQESVFRLLNGHENIIVRKGIFPETAKDLAHNQYSLVHIDADIYQSTKFALEYFWPRLEPNGALVFDDWQYDGTRGVKKAVDEYFGDTIDHIRLQAYYNQLIVFKKGDSFMGMEFGI